MPRNFTDLAQLLFRYGGFAIIREKKHKAFSKTKLVRKHGVVLWNHKDGIFKISIVLKNAKVS